MSTIIRTEEKLKNTFLDLAAGCAVYTIILELIGLVLVRNRIPFAVGVLIGAVLAIACAYSIYRTVDRSVGMSPGAAQRMAVAWSMIRMICVLIVLAAAIRLPQISFPGVVSGFLGLKISAYLHPYVRVYITGKLKKKGR